MTCIGVKEVASYTNNFCLNVNEEYVHALTTESFEWSLDPGTASPGSVNSNTPGDYHFLERSLRSVNRVQEHYTVLGFQCFQHVGWLQRVRLHWDSEPQFRQLCGQHRRADSFPRMRRPLWIMGARRA